MIAIALAAVISYDPGGTLGEYLQRAKDPHEIRGFCASACTAYLARGCVSRDAVLVFHQARNPDGSRNLLGTLMLQAQYPRGVLNWIRDHGGLTDRLLTMGGAEAIRLGVPACP